MKYNDNRILRSNILKYYITWLFTSIVFITLCKILPDLKGSFLIIWLICVFLFDGFATILEARRFKRYLNQEHQTVSSKICINDLQYSILPSFIRKKWLESGEFFGDTNVKWFKENSKRVNNFCRVSFVSTFIITISMEM